MRGNQSWMLQTAEELLICYQILALHPQKEFTIKHFLLPFRYPKSLSIYPWQGIKILYALNRLSHAGIKLRKVEYNPDSFNISGLPDELYSQEFARSVRVLGKLHHKQIPDKGPIYASPQVITYLLDHLEEWFEGSVKPEFEEVVSTEAINYLYNLPYSLQFSVKIDKRKLKKHLKDQLQSFRQGTKSLFSTIDYFGYNFCCKVLTDYIDHLSNRFGNELPFRFTQHYTWKNEHPIKDRFLSFFEKKYPDEFLISWLYEKDIIRIIKRIRAVTFFILC